MAQQRRRPKVLDANANASISLRSQQRRPAAFGIRNTKHSNDTPTPASSSLTSNVFSNSYCTQDTSKNTELLEASKRNYSALTPAAVRRRRPPRMRNGRAPPFGLVPPSSIVLMMLLLFICLGKGKKEDFTVVY